MTAKPITSRSISTHTPVRVWPVRLPQSALPLRFQLTHPWGCDFMHADDGGSILLFQLTHPWGCDLLLSSPFRSRLFQLTHPWGCDEDLIYMSISTRDFNSHTREGVTPRDIDLKYGLSFQLTHPWGCDISHRQLTNIRCISTHTPVRVWLNDQ